MRFVRSALAALVTGAALSACSSSSGGGAASSPAPTSSRPLSVSPSPSTTPTLTSDEQAAVAAYRAYSAAIADAERDPANASSEQLASVAVEPALTEILDSIGKLQTYGYAYKGIAPTVRVKVLVSAHTVGGRIEIALSDCPKVSADWAVHSTQDGSVATPVPAAVPPPYQSTILMTKIGSGWKVTSSTPDLSHTCTP